MYNSDEYLLIYGKNVIDTTHSIHIATHAANLYLQGIDVAGEVHIVRVLRKVTKVQSDYKYDVVNYK